MEYYNPIIPGYHPDPSICRVGEDFYLVTSTFEYFPGVPVFHSRNLVDWTLIGHCLTRQSQLDLRNAKSSGGIYAPTIRHNNGRFYMVTTDTTGIGNFYVTATDPAGPWSEPIPVAQGGIDPSLHFGSDGKVYFASNFLWWAEEGVYMSEIDVATGKLLTEPQFLWAGIGGKYPEAPHLYERDGWWHLLIAEGGTEFGHMVSVARARHPYGPYESCPHNPLLSHRSSRSGIQSTGHGDLFEDQNGQWWMVFLGVRHSGYPLVHHLGRETYLTPIEWTEDGWPRVPDDGLVPFRINAALPAAPQPCGDGKWEDDFSGTSLKPEWNFRRNPPEDAYTLGADGLSLRCLPTSLADVAPISFIGRRLQHFHARIRVGIDFDPQNDNEEAGTTLMMNERYFFSITIGMRGGSRVLRVRRCCGSIDVQDEFPIASSGHLEIGFDVYEDHFEAVLTGAENSDLGPLPRIETRLLCTELAGGFTGVYCGLFATGNGLDSEKCARFDHFTYHPFNSQAEWDRDIKPVTEPPLRKIENH